MIGLKAHHVCGGSSGPGIGPGKTLGMWKIVECIVFTHSLVSVVILSTSSEALIVYYGGSMLTV